MGRDDRGRSPSCLAQPQIDNILTGGPLTGQIDAAPPTPESVIAVRAAFTPPDAAGKASLAVTVTIQPGWHIYSISQKPVRAVPTTITVDESPAYRITGPFLPNLPPELVRMDGDEFEQFSGEVTWHAAIEVAKGVRSAQPENRGQSSHPNVQREELPAADVLRIRCGHDGARAGGRGGCGSVCRSQ